MTQRRSQRAPGNIGSTGDDTQLDHLADRQLTITELIQDATAYGKTEMARFLALRWIETDRQIKLIT